MQFRSIQTPQTSLIMERNKKVIMWTKSKKTIMEYCSLFLFFFFITAQSNSFFKVYL